MHVFLFSPVLFHASHRVEKGRVTLLSSAVLIIMDLAAKFIALTQLEYLKG